jgi:hypothetical protein
MLLEDTSKTRELTDSDKVVGLLSSVSGAAPRPNPDTLHHQRGSPPALE